MPVVNYDALLRMACTLSMYEWGIQLRIKTASFGSESVVHFVGIGKVNK